MKNLRKHKSLSSWNTVFAPSVGLRRPGQIDSLQNIRLSLGIIPVENVGAAIKFQIQKFVVSKIFQFQRFNLQF